MKIVHFVCLSLGLFLSATADAEEIRWKFKAGEQWTVEAEQLTEMQWSTDESEALSLTQSLAWKSAVEQVDSEGIATLSQELTRAKLTVRSNRGELSFDSAVPSSNGSSNPYWESTRAQIGKRIRVQVRSTGEVVEPNALKASGDAADTTPVSYSQLLAPSAASSATPGIGIQFPSDQIQIGEPWRTRSKLRLEGNELLVDTTYQYVGVETIDDMKLDKFKSSTGLRFAQPSAESKITKQDSEGTIWFDRGLGKVVRLECAQELMISDKSNPSQRLLQSIEMKMVPASTP